jgi:hypothetical protein
MKILERDILVCSTKRRYFSIKEASAKNFRPYKCPICWCWHRATVDRIHKKNPLKDCYRFKV